MVNIADIVYQMPSDFPARVSPDQTISATVIFVSVVQPRTCCVTSPTTVGRTCQASGNSLSPTHQLVTRAS